MINCFFRAVFFVAIFLAPLAFADDLWKAGVATENITPTESIWMAGYGSRTKPSEGKVTDLWIKVLALEDASGRRAVILTSDLLGFPRSIYDRVTADVKAKFALDPRQVILSASHTHCSPALRGALYDAYPLDQEQRDRIEKYSSELEPRIVETIGRALTDLAPARLIAGQGKTGFAVNRRNNPEGKVPQLIAEGALKGPVDHSVPVLAVVLPDGKLKAVLFGYACHNTVMSFNKWCGDYAGYAQIALEKSHPGVAGMFFMGCGGDQNPLPRRELRLAERYGNMLASAVEEVLISKPTPLHPTLSMSMEMVTLNFGAAPTETDLIKMTESGRPSEKRYATRLLAQLQAGEPFMRSYRYPVQAWQLGGKQLLVALGGEVVVDYSLKFKDRYGPQTWVAGYCNDVMTYIPSKRVLKEGGYEGGGANIAYGIPAYRWADDIEDVITASVARQVKNLRKMYK